MQGDDDRYARLEHTLQARPRGAAGAAAHRDPRRRAARGRRGGGSRGAVLTEHGLAAALGGLAARAPVPVLVEADLAERLPPAQEAALYLVAAEALTNVAKYARAGSVEVRVTRDDGRAEIAIADDGVGGASAERGSGLRGIADRIDALDGVLRVDSPPGAGTTVRARVPA